MNNLFSCPTLSTPPNIRHGFFTRLGGHSTGLYTALNCGFGSGDNIETVAKNRDLVARALGSSGDKLCTVHQIHSPDVAIVETPWTKDTAPQADAMVTTTPGIVLGILTADCVPVLFADPIARIIGGAHAGWKGSYSGVIENTIAAMERLGATRENIIATIGPAIEQKSYEVGPEFLERLTAQDPANARFFISSLKEGHHMFNLKGYVKNQLIAARVAPNMLANDTCSEEDTFFSFRRATLRKEPVYGRQISAITLT